MSYLSQPRLIRRRRRPATRSQVRQRARQMRDLYPVGFAFDQLFNNFMSEDFCSIEEEL